MKVRVDDHEWTGRAVDLAGVASADAVAAGIRGDDGPVVVSCPPPGPLHDHLCVIREAQRISLGRVLAAAARTRGVETPHDAALGRVRARLSSFDAQEADAERRATDVERARRRVAEVGTEEADLRERLGRLQGRVQAGDEDAVEAREEAARRLAAVETDRIAAEQTLRRTRREVREARDRRAERLRLQDRCRTLNRRVRAELVASVWPAFRAAVDRVPGTACAGPEPGEFEGDGVTASFAVVRVASLDAPVVLDCDRFPDAETAARTLDAPVVRV